jgi:hypothetical protein
MTILEFKPLRKFDSKPCTHFDPKLIRVVIINPYNKTIRRIRIARGLFALDAVDAGCLQFGAKITRFNELHTETGGKWPHCFLIRGLNVHFGIGFVTGCWDEQGRPRSSRITLAKMSSLVWFPNTFRQEL